MKKVLKFIILLSTVILLSGCAEKFSYVVNENPVRPQIIEDKALIYVIRPSYIGFMVPFKVYLDDKPIGLTKGKTYFYFYTSPGKHILKTVSGNTSELALNLAANKKYYVKQTIILDKIMPKNKTMLISEEEGEASIKKTNMLQFLKLPKFF